MSWQVTRRQFLGCVAALGAFAALPATAQAVDWRDLLPNYLGSTRRNIVTVNGRRALLSSRPYPGTYVRDAVFWGPLALEDPALGYECYSWFEENQLPSGQIPTAIPLAPEEAPLLVPQDDEGTLLFLIASDWLAQHGYPVQAARLEAAWAWVRAHVTDHHYVSKAGPFRYWADTVSPDRDDVIAHNQGLYCLALRALANLELGGVTQADIRAAQERYRQSYLPDHGYIPLGRTSNFALAQDISAIFPEFLSRYLYDEPILTDAMLHNHIERLLGNASVYRYRDDGRLAGVKVISGAQGEFLPPDWFFAPSLNVPGRYQNGGYWPLYTLVALALAYQVAPSERYMSIVAILVENELATDGQSKEVLWLGPGEIGLYQPEHVNYTWNALIPRALHWSGLAA